MHIRPHGLVASHEAFAVVEKADAGEEALPVVLLRDVVGPAAEVRCRAGTLDLLAHEVDQGDVLVGELLPIRVPPEVVRPDADEDHLAVVELVLAVDMHRELAVLLHELPDPTHLLPPGDQDAVHVELGALEGDVEQVTRLYLLQYREGPRTARAAGAVANTRPRHGHKRVELCERCWHSYWRVELLQLKEALDVHAPRLALLDVSLS